MPSDALTRLLNATRPYKKFTVKVNEVEEDFYARRPGSIESARVNKAFEAAYAESKRDSQTPDYTSLFTQLKRQDNVHLASFIVKADHQDYLQEASMLNNDAPLDDPRVIEDANSISEQKLDEYTALTHDELMTKAWDRREHFQAVADGQTASNYMMGVVTLFAKQEDGSFTPLFESIDEAKQLPLDMLVTILTEAFKTIGESNDSPLKSAPSPSSDEPTPSADEKAAESPSPISSGP